jgi:hypothetical protein
VRDDDGDQTRDDRRGAAPQIACCFVFVHCSSRCGGQVVLNARWPRSRG